MNNNITPGTVSHGTLRDADLAQAFLGEADRIEAPVPALLRATAEAVATEQLDLETSSEALVELMDLLNEHAPEGLLFGAHEGDGSDFGWWAIEEDE